MVTAHAGAVVPVVRAACEADCKGITIYTNQTAPANVRSIPSLGPETISCPSTVSLLTGQRYEATGVQACQVGPRSSAGVKEEPRVLYTGRPEEQGKNIRVVQVKQESMEYTCAGNI